MCTGLVTSVLGVALGPTLWFGPGASPVQLADPTIISLPLGFLGCVLGSLLIGSGRGTGNFAEIELQANLGREPIHAAPD